MNDCKYCKKDANGVSRNLGSDKIFDQFSIIELNNVYRITSLHKSDDEEGFATTKPINYCPMCGRNLGD